MKKQLLMVLISVGLCSAAEGDVCEKNSGNENLEVVPGALNKCVRNFDLTERMKLPVEYVKKSLCGYTPNAERILEVRRGLLGQNATIFAGFDFARVVKGPAENRVLNDLFGHALEIESFGEEDDIRLQRALKINFYVANKMFFLEILKRAREKGLFL